MEESSSEECLEKLLNKMQHWTVTIGWNSPLARGTVYGILSTDEELKNRYVLLQCVGHLHSLSFFK